MIVILMVIAIALIVLGLFMPSETKEKIEIEILSKEAMKMNHSEGGCIYFFNSTIINKGDEIKNAIFKIEMIKNNSVIELDEFSIGDLDKEETKVIEKNYTRSCDYLDNFKINIKN